MVDFLRQALAGVGGIRDIKPKYTDGSLAHIHFHTSQDMWTLLRNKPHVEHDGSLLWYTIPKSQAEREFGTVMSKMARAIDALHEDDPPTQILWRSQCLKFKGSVVARYAPHTDNRMELSAAQLQKAGTSVAASVIMDKFNELRAATDPQVEAQHATDWS